MGHRMPSEELEGFSSDSAANKLTARVNTRSGWRQQSFWRSVVCSSVTCPEPKELYEGSSHVHSPAG